MDTLQTLEKSNLFAEFDIAEFSLWNNATEVTEIPDCLQESVAKAIDNHYRMIDIAVNRSELDEELLTLSLEILEAELMHSLKDKAKVEMILEKLCEEA